MYLADIVDSCEAISASLDGKSLELFQSDRVLRGHAERELSIVGEATVQLLKQRADLAGRITDSSSIVRFRNLLIHAYHLIDPATVWFIVHTDLPLLRAEAAAILSELGESPGT